MDQTLQFTLLGVGTGSIYTLVAFGVVLVYRGSGIVNFASGAMGMACAFIFFDLRPTRLGTVGALVVALILGALLGSAIHLGLLRFLQEKSALNRLMMTLAVFLTLQSAAEVRWGFDTVPESAVLPIGRIQVMTGVFVTWDRLYLAAVAIVLTVGLQLMSTRTRFGLATLAVSESPRAAEALGHSSNRIAAANWAIAGALSALAAVLAAPTAGLSAANTSLLVVPALAAALVGRFASFPRTLVGGLAIGIAQSQMARFSVAPGIATTVPFVVIILVLVLRGRALPVRGSTVDKPAQFGTGRLRPIATAIAIAVVVLVANEVMTSSWVDALVLSMIGSILVLSVVVVTGFAGQLSLAQMALAGMGAFIAARLIDVVDLGFEAALLVALVGSVVVGLVVALPSLRTRGINLAIATMGVGIFIAQMVLSDPDLIGGVVGTNIGPTRLFGYDLHTVLNPRTYAFVVLGVLVVCFALVSNLRNSGSGRRLIAIRSGERAAATLGIDVVGGKLYAFTFAAVLAGLAGVLTAYRSPLVEFDTYTVLASIGVVLYAVIGGVGFVTGALVGGLMVPGGLSEHLLASLFGSEAASWTQLIASLMTLVILIQMPDGLVAGNIEMVRALAAKVVRRPARPRPAPSVSPQATATSIRSGGKRLEVENLTVRYGSFTALRDVSFRIQPGEILGVIGPNGAGKTTLIDAVTGLTASAAGRILVDGTQVQRMPPHVRARLGVARSFQGVELFESMDVLNNIRTGADPRHSFDYVRDTFWPRKVDIGPIAAAAVREFELGDLLTSMPADLPHSQRRLVGIARGMATGASILLLDEPAAGLDAHECDELSALIRRLAKDLNVAVLVVEHHVPFVLGLCDQVLALNFGETIALGSANAVSRSPAVIDAYLGQPVGARSGLGSTANLDGQTNGEG